MPAAGTGARLQHKQHKAWVSLGGRPLIAHALETFRRQPEVREIVLVVAAEDAERARQLIAAGPSRVTEKVVVGGGERRDSVWHGLQEITDDTEIVLVHDAARPLITPATISACIAAIHHYGAAVVARPLADTVKRATADGDVAATVERAGLWGAQTPQGARTALLRAAYARAIAEDWPVTDDAGVLERCGHRVHLVAGDALNFKITHPEDLALAERLLAVPRVGFGHDVHRLVPDRPLILGGVTVPHYHGLLGHSDADVLTHALMDALLGAAALGDIGQHFPDSDERYRGVSSLTLLAAVRDRIREAGYGVVNVDATIVAQAPKLATFIPVMRANIADVLGIDVTQVSIKATTTEGLGFTGMEDGMAADAVACLVYEWVSS